MARIPRPWARWDLPTPGGPRKSAFSLRLANSQVAKRSTWFLSRPRWKLKSYSSEGLGEAQAAELQSRLDAPLLTSLALLLKDVLEEVLEAVLLANALLEEFGEPLGRELEAQGAQQRSAAIEARSDAHRARLSRFS